MLQHPTCWSHLVSVPPPTRDKPLPTAGSSFLEDWLPLRLRLLGSKLGKGERVSRRRRRGWGRGVMGCGEKQSSARVLPFPLNCHQAPEKPKQVT